MERILLPSGPINNGAPSRAEETVWQATQCTHIACESFKLLVHRFLQGDEVPWLSLLLIANGNSLDMEKAALFEASSILDGM